MQNCGLLAGNIVKKTASLKMVTTRFSQILCEAIQLSVWSAYYTLLQLEKDKLNFHFHVNS